MKRKTRQKLMWLAIIIFVVVAPPIVLYTTGWRLTTDLRIKRTGGLFVAVPESGAEVYIDGKLRSRTNFLQSGVFIQSLTPATYSVLVAKKGFWPWAKRLQVKEASVVESRALMLPQTITGEQLIRGRFERVFAADHDSVLLLEEKSGNQFTFTFYSPENNKFLTAADARTKKLLNSSMPLKTLVSVEGGAVLFFENSTVKVSFNHSLKTLEARLIGDSNTIEDDLPATAHKIALDSRGKARAWYDEENKIWVQWLAKNPLPYYLKQEKTNIFQARSPIKQLAFLPKRNDILLVAIENGVFALEIDGSGTRNFQPLYKGSDPSFARLGNTIYILDQGALSKVEF